MISWSWYVRYKNLTDRLIRSLNERCAETECDGGCEGIGWCEKIMDEILNGKASEQEKAPVEGNDRGFLFSEDCDDRAKGEGRR